MTLPILWFIIIAVLISAYYVLDGFDLGAGILSPFVAKTPGEKRALMTSIGPVWDGNEVWLLTAGGALFAAFAPAIRDRVFRLLPGHHARALRSHHPCGEPRVSCA